MMKNMKKCFLKINQTTFQSSTTQKLTHLRGTTNSTPYGYSSTRMTPTLARSQIRPNSAANFNWLAAVKERQRSSNSQSLRSTNDQLMMRTFTWWTLPIHAAPAATTACSSMTPEEWHSSTARTLLRFLSNKFKRATTRKRKCHTKKDAKQKLMNCFNQHIAPLVYQTVRLNSTVKMLQVLQVNPVRANLLSLHLRPLKPSKLIRLSCRTILIPWAIIQRILTEQISFRPYFQPKLQTLPKILVKLTPICLGRALQIQMRWKHGNTTNNNSNNNEWPKTWIRHNQNLDKNKT